jgi:hypothetical protein
MIVTATPDLVLDVLQAADPTTQRAATAKLDSLKPSDADFGTALSSQAADAAAAARNPPSAPTAQADASAGAAAPVRVIRKPPEGEVYRKFEAFVLQTFVETMLPQQEDLFGEGTAGNIWRSMMAEQLGNQLAQGKGIGIAKQLAAAHPAHGGTSNPSGPDNRSGANDKS